MAAKKLVIAKVEDPTPNEINIDWKTPASNVITVIGI
jgi:hypothetical protein